MDGCECADDEVGMKLTLVGSQRTMKGVIPDREGGRLAWGDAVFRRRMRSSEGSSPLGTNSFSPWSFALFNHSAFEFTGPVKKHLRTQRVPLQRHLPFPFVAFPQAD